VASRSAARNQRYKLVDGKELYDLEKDPEESTDVASLHPDIVKEMSKGYEDWFRDVSSTRGYAPPRIHIGTKHENPVTLTRQDWRGPKAGWADDSLGHWEVDVRSGGRYRVTLRMPPAEAGGEARFSFNGISSTQSFPGGASQVRLDEVTLQRATGRVEAALSLGSKEVGPHYIDLEKLA
jgi:hypothetical protein